MDYEFLQESFMYFYYASHGCADTQQYVMLNEKNVNDIFWPAEQKTRKLLERNGGQVKAVVIFDCSRENYQELKEKIEGKL